MKVLWLGQGGLLFVSGKKKVMVDPYLTNSLTMIDYTLDRRMKVNKKIFSVRPDVLILTNCHPDHADIETISRFAKKQKGKLTILSCENVFLDIADHEHCARANNIMFEQGAEWSIEGFNIRAVKAKTDDKSAFGVIITDTQTNEKYYVAGDTLYSREVLAELDEDVFAIFVPINGEYGSMNVIDAKRFAIASGATYAVPVHFGMLDKISPESFDLENAIIPKIYRIIDFGASEAPDKKQIDRRFNERPSTNPVTALADDEEAENIEAIEEAQDCEEFKVIEEVQDCEEIKAIEEFEPAEESDIAEDVDPAKKIETEEDVIEENDDEENEASEDFDDNFENEEQEDFSFSFFDDEDEDEEDYNTEPLEFEPFTDQELMSFAGTASENELTDELSDEPDDSNSLSEPGYDNDSSDEQADNEETANELTDSENEPNDYDFSFFDDEVEKITKEETDDAQKEIAPVIKHTPRVSDEDDAEKIDAYVRELEKLERGETSDFDALK